MKIIYFTSTGNCLAAAKRFDAELLSIPQLEREKVYKITDDAVGIITPVYGFTMPEPVSAYLSRVKIHADYVFVVATYGNMAGGVLHEVKKLLEAHGNHADYYELLLTIDNYLPQYEVNKQLAMEKHMEENLSRIVKEVTARTKKDENSGLGWNFASALFGAVQGTFTKKRAIHWFRVSDDCVGCGICVKVCPVSNVKQNGKNKPVFSDTCVSCFACTHNCPQKAIHLKNERSGVRYRNPAVSLKEIIAANDQGQ